MLLQECLSIVSFMERGIVKYNDGLLRQGFQETVLHPIMKHIRIDIRLKKSNRNQRVIKQSTDGINPTFLLPIMRTITPFSSLRIAMCTWGINSKATLIDVHDRSFLCVIPGQGLTKCIPFFGAGFWVLEAFFYTEYLAVLTHAISRVYSPQIV